jgi:hypothetical protein
MEVAFLDVDFQSHLEGQRGVGQLTAEDVRSTGVWTVWDLSAHCIAKPKLTPV